MEWFNQNAHWAWLIAGIVLMALEIFGASGYLLVAGLSAALVALLSYLIPALTLKWQLLIFGFDLVLLAVALTLWFRSRATQTNSVDIGMPGADLIGRTVVLQNPVQNFESKIRLQDANWEVSCATDQVDAGQRIKITAVKGRTLIVEPLS